MKQVETNAPSRICLFGEHQDYLGLEVIAMAIDLRFYGKAKVNDGKFINIKIRDSSINKLLEKNEQKLYKHLSIDLTEPIVYEKSRDYLRSSVNTLLKNGYSLKGMDITLDSDIPIGKGMCSSSTMIICLLKVILAAINHADKDNGEKIAQLGFQAEVLEFGEPGGMMDHYAASMGGTLNIEFGDETIVRPLPPVTKGEFVLIDTLEQKNTTVVLAQSKFPTLAALAMLEPYGITSVKDFVSDHNLKYLDELDTFHKTKLLANINNYKLLQQAKSLLSGEYTPQQLGDLILQHHINLRDGLGISTPIIEKLLAAAIKAGALGGKVNGSGGGGCLFVYTDDKADAIIEAITALGYPCKRIKR